MIFHQSHKFLAISRHSRYNIFTLYLVFLLLVMTLEYLRILEIRLQLFQKQYNSLIKRFFQYTKRAKYSKGSRTPNDVPPPYGHSILGSNKKIKKLPLSDFRDRTLNMQERGGRAEGFCGGHEIFQAYTDGSGNIFQNF